MTVDLRATVTTDWVQAATIYNVSSQAAGYPITNIQDPASPDIPWKSTAATLQLISMDLGSAKAVQWWALLYTNFASVQIWADDANTFDSGGGGEPNYKSAVLTIGESPLNGRLCLWHAPTSTVTRRFWRIVIPEQTPVTGIANQTDLPTAFRLGAFLVCPLTTIRNFRWGFDPTPTQPIIISRSLGGGSQSLLMGPEYARLTGTRNALVRVASNGAATGTLLADGVAEWIAFERRWKAAGRALVAPFPDNPYAVALLRHVSARRSVQFPADDVSFEWEEVA
jgi:hypothetical protein